MYNFIPKRKEKIKNSGNLEENKHLSLEELFLKDIDEEIIDNLEKEKILTKFLLKGAVAAISSFGSLNSITSRI